MRMAPSGQADTQYSSLVQSPTRTRAAVRSRRSKQPWGQIELHIPHPWQRSRRTEGIHFCNGLTLLPRTATKPMIASRFLVETIQLLTPGYKTALILSI